MARVFARSILIVAPLLGRADTDESHPSFSYEVARAHELQPHRGIIPSARVRSGLKQLRLKLVVSPDGRVLNAEPNAESTRASEPTAEAARALLAFWPEARDEVSAWKFRPFEKDGKAVIAEIDEHVVFAPSERSPKRHVAPPRLSADSRIAITLRRSICFGTCPAYTVSIGAAGTADAAEVSFEGLAYVVAPGAHTGSVPAGEVQSLARRFIDADFYSMEEEYRWPATDLPTHFLSITIDGQRKYVTDYGGVAAGMPGVITELEGDVDRVAGTQRWIEGADGLVPELQHEKFDFRSTGAQMILKEAAVRGQTSTVKGLLAAGVPLSPFPRSEQANPFYDLGWLGASSRHADTLRIFINAGASRSNQADKDIALDKAARSGSVEAVRALIAYGANPNADFRRLLPPGRTVGGIALETLAPGMVLGSAARSGNPELVKELLQYHPNLEVKDRDGRTALFAVDWYRNPDQARARVQLVRLLTAAGANVNARDKDGNTPLHLAFSPEVVAELLKSGADVNARNSNGETPIFTTPNDENIPLFIRHGADLSIRDVSGRTAVQAANKRGPSRPAALAKAIEAYGHN